MGYLNIVPLPVFNCLFYSYYDAYKYTTTKLIDGTPGRLNQNNFIINRPGLFYIVDCFSGTDTQLYLSLYNGW